MEMFLIGCFLAEKSRGPGGIRLDSGCKTCDGWIVEVFSTRKAAITAIRGKRDALLLVPRTTGWFGRCSVHVAHYL